MAAHAVSKSVYAHFMMNNQPQLWFQQKPIDERDRALLSAPTQPWLQYGQGSFLKKLCHLERGKTKFLETPWTVEQDVACKKLIRESGGKLAGFNFGPPAAVNWAIMTIFIQVRATPGSGYDWGILSTQGSNVRIFRGPDETCAKHPWDAMILRDCTTNSDGIADVEGIASRKWDILAMKMCEDHDFPWIICAVRDTGAAKDAVKTDCDCCKVPATHTVNGTH